jgi:hypothetical protein
MYVYKASVDGSRDQWDEDPEEENQPHGEAVC